MSKKPKSFNVSNPTSNQHLVRLCTEQSIRLRLDDSFFRDHRLQFSTQNLFIENVEEHPQYVIYEIAQSPQVKKWADYSNIFLGDIWIDCSKHSSKMNVLLDTNNKSKLGFVTTINPDCTEIRIVPGDILEFILFDESFGIDASWSWQYQPELKSGVELLGSQTLSVNPLTEDHPDLPYARCLRLESFKKSFWQQHFWFRFDKSLLHLIGKETESKKIGTLSFFGYPEKKWNFTAEYHVAIHVKFDLEKSAKYKMRAFNSLLLPKIDSKPISEGFILPPNFYRTPVYFNSKHKVMEVQATLLSTKSLEEGCNTESAITDESLDAENHNASCQNYRFEHKAQRHYDCSDWRDDFSDWRDNPSHWY
jgi:hypothetical protein